MPVFPVTDTPHFVSGPFSRPYLIRNAGAEVVYLGQDSSLAVGSQAISMNPGGTLNWSGETELWALSDPGKTSTLEILYTGDSAFTPGPDSVSLNQSAEVLYSGIVALPFPWIVNPIDLVVMENVERYQSLFIAIDVPAPIAATPNVFATLILQYDALGNLIDTATPYWSGTGTFSIPILGSFVTVQVLIDTPFTTTNRNIQVSVSTAPTERKYMHRNGVNADIVNASAIVVNEPLTPALNVSVEFLLNASTAATWFAPSASGRAKFFHRITGATAGNTTIEIAPGPTSVPIFRYVIDPSDIGIVEDLILPEMPLFVTVTPPAGAKRFYGSLTFG